MSCHLDVPGAPPRSQPASRDRFVDLLRTFSMLAVVLGHWIMPVLAYRGGTLSVGDSLATPGWWSITWLAQVMPVFFAVGGAANYHSYAATVRRGGNARDWLAARVCRLSVPVLPVLAVWLVLPRVLAGFGAPAGPLGVATGVVGQLLWFLAVYLLTVAMAPVLVAAHRRFGLLVPVVLAAVAVGVDALRFGGLPLLGYANEVVIWLAVQQLGIAYAAGSFARLTGRAAAGIGVAGFALTGLLVCFGPYPASMVGLPGDPVSNMSPATVCLLTLGCGQLGVLYALRARIVRFGARPLVARLHELVGSRCMTVYLWHMTAMVVLAGIAVLGFGYATPAAGSLAWLVATPIWVAVLAAMLRGLLWLFAAVERATVPAMAGPGLLRLLGAVLLVFAGLLGIAAWGFTLPTGLFALVHGPVPASAAILTGLSLVLPQPVRRTRRWLRTRLARLLGTLTEALP